MSAVSLELAPVRLFRAVRDFAQTTQEWESAVRYFTKPDEEYDLTLVSQRVYGTRNYTLVIQAAAGMDSPEYKLKATRLVLPTLEQLRQMRIKAGYSESELV